MKKAVIILFLLFSTVFAGVLDECYKIFNYSADETFLGALSALNSSSKFEISEIQSQNGNILFLYGSKYYLLTVTKRYQNQTEIKILPQNSEYSQGSLVAKTLFALIEDKLKNQPMELVK